MSDQFVAEVVQFTNATSRRVLTRPGLLVKLTCIQQLEQLNPETR